MFARMTLIIITLFLLSCLAASEIQQMGLLPTACDTKLTGVRKHSVAPSYTFSKTPTPLLQSFQDYMIGSYNGLPLRVIPESAGGGYFMTYHGQRSALGLRQVFYAYLTSSGNVVHNSEFLIDNYREGFPTLAVDPVSGKPFYAWQTPYLTNDAQLEIRDNWDAFIDGIDGLWNYPQVIVDNPTQIVNTSYITTADNEFLWPTAAMGPSPIGGKRRIYVATKNIVSHTLDNLPSENVDIAYADFNATDIENSVDLEWSHTSIPILNQWNADETSIRRPNMNLVCDNAGNLYYFGYHTANDSNEAPINEPDVDVFKCPAYGAGTWERLTFSSSIPTWNPSITPGGAGFFVDLETGTPYPDSQLNWKINNSPHSNATIDSSGKIHMPGLWSVSTDTGSYYYGMQFVKEMVYNPASLSISVRDVYPQKKPADNYNQTYCPWDKAFPWGEVDQYETDEFGNTYPVMAGDWNFPYWNIDSHDNAMMYQCSNIKTTESNAQGMMAIVWQNSLRAKEYNESQDSDFEAFANTPEIFISVSSDNGLHWSEPIVLNNQETAAFTGLKPMWVYPADKIKYVGWQGQNRIGKLGLMFYDDNTWGSYSASPTEFPNDGGRIMFCELQIVFPTNIYNTDPFGSPTVLDGSMSLIAGVVHNGVAAKEGDVLAAYVTVGGQAQLRGKAILTVQDEMAVCLLQVYTATNGETITFKLWDSEADVVYDISNIIYSQVNGSIGQWPNDILWLVLGHPNLQTIDLATGWSMISFNVHSASMQITEIIGPSNTSIVSIKCPDGVFMPGNPFNTLSSFIDGKGYCVLSCNASSISVLGLPVDPSDPIPMHSGWNLCAFTPQTPLAAGTAISSIASSLLELKGTEGIYIPGNPYNTLTTLSPGRSYWMKLNDDATLLYSPGVKADAQPLVPTCELWGSPVIKSNSESMLFCVEGEVNNGDLLAAFVGDELRGLGTMTISGGMYACLMQVFTDVVGEELLFKLYSTDTGKVELLEPGMVTDPGETLGDYSKGEYVFLKTGLSETQLISTTLVSAFPNPFGDETSITMEVGKNGKHIKLELYNIRGQKIRNLYQGQMPEGPQQLNWDACDDAGNKVASGLYFCRLTCAGIKQNLKLMVIK